MTPAEWRALIEAYLEGRIGPDAFSRRLLEAARAERARGGRLPSAIEQLALAAEAFEADNAAHRQDEPNDEALLETARRAIAPIEDMSPTTARTHDRARAREDMRRFSVQMSGCAGMGCVIALIWLGLCLLQVSAVSAQVQAYLGWSAAPATFAGFALAFIPVVGNVIAFFGATDQWGWAVWQAALVFFAAPAATLFSGWARWRQYGH